MVVRINTEAQTWKIKAMTEFIAGPTWNELVNLCAYRLMESDKSIANLLLEVNSFIFGWFGMKYEPQDLIEFADEVAKRIIRLAQ